MKILITGGAGYKGTKLTKKLLEDGHSVCILDNFMYGHDSVLSFIENKNLKIIKKDIRGINKSDVENYDMIVHLAALCGVPLCQNNPTSAYSINVESTKRLTQILDDEQKLIYASTSSIYGNSDKICTEESPILSNSIYSQTKYEAEKIVNERKNSISLRVSVIFGVSYRMNNDTMINDFVYKSINDKNLVLFDKNSKMPFIHIDDVIESYLFALNNFDSMKDNTYNIGDESLIFSKIDIAENIKKYINLEIIESNLKNLNSKNSEVSFEKIRNKGYKTSKSLDDGIRDLIKLYSFYKNNTII